MPTESADGLGAPLLCVTSASRTFPTFNAAHMQATWRSLLTLDILGSLLVFFLTGLGHESGYLHAQADSVRWDDALIDMVVLSAVRVSIYWILFDAIKALASARARDVELPQSKERVWLALVIALSVASFIYTIVKSAFIFHNGPSQYEGSVGIIAFLVLSLVVVTLELFLAVFRLNPYFKELVRQEIRSTSINGSDVSASSDVKKSKGATFMRLAKQAEPEKWILSAGLFCLVFSSGANIASPYFFGEIINAASTDHSSSGMARNIIILGIIYTVGSIAAFFRVYLFTLAGQRFVARLRCLLFSAIVHQEIAFFDQNRTGELTNRLSSDTAVVQDSITMNLAMLVNYTLQVCALPLPHHCPRL